MNFKDKLTRKLLETGKKHRLLVYPTLALVAIITAISHAVYWGRGNGKRFVASAMIMVMLFTQSLFLTSSANVETEEGQSGETTEIAIDISEITEPTDNGEITLIDSDVSDATTEASTMDIINPDELNQMVNDSTTEQSDMAQEPDANQEGNTSNTTEAIVDDGSTTETVVDNDDGLSGEVADDTTEQTVVDDTTESDTLMTNSQVGLVGDELNGADGTTENPGTNGSQTSEPRTIHIIRVNEKNEQSAIGVDWTDNFTVVESGGNKTVTFDLPDLATVLEDFAGDNRESAHFEINGLYSDAACTTPLTSPVEAEYNPSGEYNVYCKITRTVYPVRINVNGVIVNDVVNVGSNKVIGCINPNATYAVPTKNAAIYQALDADGDGSPDGGAYAWGKSYIGLSYNDGMFTLPSDNSTAYVDIKNVSPDASAVNMTALWEGHHFDVNYVFVDQTKDSHIELDKKPESNTRRYKLDGMKISLISNQELTTKNEGYYLSHWTDGTTEYLADGTTYDPSNFAVNNTTSGIVGVNAPDDKLLNGSNMSGKTLTAVWKYKETRLLAEGGEVDNATGNVTVTGTYGSEIECTISAEYLMPGTPKFSMDVDDTKASELLNKYGISAKENSDGTITLSGKLDNITTGTGLVIPFTLKDENKPNTDAPENKTITLIANKKEVSIDKNTIKNSTGNGAPSKSYDGEVEINVKPQADVVEKVSGDDVYVTFDAMAKLNNANACDDGEKRNITLSKVALAGNDKDMYILTDLVGTSTDVTLTEVATVFKIPVTVSVTLDPKSTNSILFGQATPNYIVRLANPAALASDDYDTYITLDEASKDAFMSNVIGFTGKWNTTRKLYSEPNSYTITPEFVSVDKNYSVDVTGVAQTFNVGRESADGYYTISPEPINGYYPKMTITPSGGIYNEVRIVTDGADISEETDSAAVPGMFEPSVTITKDMTLETIKFQLYDNKTGAISEIETLNNVNIDGSGPTLEGVTVSPVASYFNQFGFGAYYHAQTIDGKLIESVDITLKYLSKDSKCDVLKYYFTDENGNTKSEFSGTVKLNKNAADEYYTATINIGTGTSGQLIVYALDTTGNPSEKSKIKLEEFIGLAQEGLAAENYYEWMVENTIDSAEIIVTDANGNATDTNIWYNGLNINVLAADSDSGVNKIEWLITDPSGTTSKITEDVHESVKLEVLNPEKGTATSYGKLTAYNFSTTIAGSDAGVGEYYISAILTDNAGNSREFEQKGPYLFDGNAPTITHDDYEAEDDEYLSGVVFEFEVADGTDESGIATVQLFYKSDDGDILLQNWGEEGTYSKEITSNGTYVIVATDNAGNEAREEVTFSGISDVVPETPVITVDGTKGNDGWYKEVIPTVTITSQDKTSDGVPVTTTYKLTVGGNQIQANVENVEEKINLTSEGEILIEAWSKSKADCLSETATETIKIDINGPEITITDSTVDKNGNTLIKFTVTDKISGVDLNEVYVNDEVVKVTEDNGIVTGSFLADSNQNYSIVAKDIAGNESDATDFAPLKLQVSPVINITPTGAYIEAQVIEGTYPISDCYIAYKKASENDYDTALSNKHNKDYGVSMDYTFRNLASNTVYDYRVYAIASNSNEVQVVEGSFRTADLKSTATVYGSVTYAKDLADAYKTYPVYVALYDANTVIAGVELEKPEDTDYLFKNVADGNYRIVASNGMLSEVSTVTVKNGGITYPKDYASKGGVHFVLDGLSTDVVVEDNSISITADGLDKIYNTALYNGNVTDEDLEVVAAGGTVDITLYASYMNVSSVDKNTESIFANKIGKNGVIERYISLYVMKEVRDVDGKLVNGTPMNITRLAEPVTISFPLGELSGQKIYVASVHQNGSDYAYINWAGSDVTLSQNYVTISTDRFSVYALYRLIETKKEYTVKWIDGNGNIMKTETVVEGNKATPPKDTPKKAETEKYTYVFSGWDTDYSKITKDTVISAWFVAKEKEVKPPTTEAPPTTEDPSTTVTPPTTETPSTTETPVNKPSDNNDADKDDITKEPTNYPYMGSGISPKTGDMAPIVGVMALMLLSGAGLIIINKRKKEE